MERGEKKYLGILPTLLGHIIKIQGGKYGNKNSELFAAFLHGEGLSHEEAASRDFDKNIFFENQNFSGLRVIRIFHNSPKPNEHISNFIECKHSFNISHREARNLERLDERPRHIFFPGDRSNCDINHSGGH